MTSIRSPQQLGDTLRAARKQLGLTQPQLALAAGVGVRFIVDLEAGKPTARLDKILKVMFAFDLLAIIVPLEEAMAALGQGR